MMTHTPPAGESLPGRCSIRHLSSYDLFHCERSTASSTQPGLSDSQLYYLQRPNEPAVKGVYSMIDSSVALFHVFVLEYPMPSLSELLKKGQGSPTRADPEEVSKKFSSVGLLERPYIERRSNLCCCFAIEGCQAW